MRCLLLYLDPYGGIDPVCMFPLFLKRTADVMSLRLSVVFRWLVRLGSFPACRRQANVARIPKGPPSSSVANHRPISITSELCKVFERLVSVRLIRFMERSGVLPTTSLLIGKVWVPVMNFCVSHALQSALETGQEARIVQIDISAAFDRVNHLGILYKLCSVGIGGSVLSILTQFLANRSQHVMVDGCIRSAAGQCFGPVIQSFFPFWKIS